MKKNEGFGLTRLISRAIEEGRENENEEGEIGERNMCEKDREMRERKE